MVALVTLLVSPNPFIEQTGVSYSVAEPQHVSLKVYNTLGQLVHTLVNRVHQPGNYTVQWKGDKGCCSRFLSGGVYFLKFEAGDVTEVKKMVLIR